MKHSERIGLLIASLMCFFAAGVNAAQPAAGKAKVIHLPRDVQVIHGKDSLPNHDDYLISKGAEADGTYIFGTFFVESDAKLHLHLLLHNTVFIKKGGELETEGDGWLRVYYEKGAKIGKPIGTQQVFIECDSITFKPFQPFTLKGTIPDADGKAIAGIRVHAYNFNEEIIGTTVTDRKGAFAFRPQETIAYVVADLAPAWRAGLAIRDNTALSFRRHTQSLYGWEAEIREGFWGEDTALTIAPSGKRRLTLRRLRKLIGHETAIRSMSFARDGRALATSSSHLIRLWDVDKGEELRVFDAECNSNEICLTSDGKMLATWGMHAGIRLWDTAKGELVREFRSDSGQSTCCLAFSPDGKTLAARGEEAIRLWDVGTGKPRGVWKTPVESVSSLIFNPDGQTLVSAGIVTGASGNNSSIHYDRIDLWDAATGRALGNFAGGCSLAFSADGQRLASYGRQFIQLSEAETSRNDFLTLRRLDTGQTLLRIKVAVESNATADPAVTLTPDGKFLVAVANDVLHFWGIASGQEILAVPLPSDSISLTVFSPDGRTLAVGHSDGLISLWDVRPHHLYVTEAKARSDAELEKLWENLASNKAATAYRALWTLLREPPRAVTLLRTHLRPTPPRQLPLSQWIADLDNDDYTKRQAAAKSLREAGESAERVLRQTLGNKPSLEARKRIEKILEEIDRRRPSAEELRSLRAIQLLEEIGSPEARRLLRTLAEGWSEARQTREAKAALKRRLK